MHIQAVEGWTGVNNGWQDSSRGLPCPLSSDHCYDPSSVENGPDLRWIGDVPDTIEDQAVVIVMRRGAPDERSSPTAPAAMVQPSTSSVAASPAGSATSCTS
jgi:hypothetical protein